MVSVCSQLPLTAVSVHQHCLSLVHLSCGNPNCHMDNLGIYLRHFYLGSRVTGAV